MCIDEDIQIDFEDEDFKEKDSEERRGHSDESTGE
jgi:hypothetical protein